MNVKRRDFNLINNCKSLNMNAFKQYGCIIKDSQALYKKLSSHYKSAIIINEARDFPRSACCEHEL